jgi:hypothetical protein
MSEMDDMDELDEDISWCAYICNFIDKILEYDETDIYFIL